MLRALLIFSLILLLPSIGRGQSSKAKKKKVPARIPPTVADFQYGQDSDRQKLDFWQAKSDSPAPLVVMIHGGGWLSGDKKGYGLSVKPYLDKGISVAAINYRLIPEAMEQRIEPPVKAPMHDAARAIQMLRYKAKEWNINPDRIGATGSSAGACTSLWLALHDDLADPNSSDPVARESSRLACAAVVGAQTTLDPKPLREWITNAIYGGHAFGFRAEGRSRSEEFDLLLEHREKLLPWIEEYSPIEHVSADDPPVYMDYPKQTQRPLVGYDEEDPTHSALYGLKLQEKLLEAKVEAVVAFPKHDDHGDFYGSVQDFLITKLTEK